MMIVTGAEEDLAVVALVVEEAAQEILVEGALVGTETVEVLLQEEAALAGIVDAVENAEALLQIEEVHFEGGDKWLDTILFIFAACVKLDLLQAKKRQRKITVKSAWLC